MRERMTHPRWCSQRCRTAGAPLGEHRGVPVRVPGRVSALVTLVQPAGSAVTYAEVRMYVRVQGESEQAQAVSLWRLLAGLARFRRDLAAAARR